MPNSNVTNRFDWILAGHREGPDTLCDVDLFDDPRGAVIPSLGSLVPGWLLAIPRRAVLRTADLPAVERKALLRLALDVSRAVAEFAPRVFVFEHGPSRIDAPLGCGADQAHLHVVPTGVDLVEAAQTDSTVQWRRAGADPWAGIGPDEDYYLIHTPEQAYVGTASEPRTQYFRRLLARELGRADDFDYRLQPERANIKLTLDRVDRRLPVTCCDVVR